MVSIFFIELFNRLQKIVWSLPITILILLIGIYFTIKTNFFQFRYFIVICKKTILSIFDNKKSRTGGLSPFKTLATTLSATLGMGSIAGVATAIVSGGAGAVFWMWISAIFGTMTAYAENLIALYYREKDERGQFCGGTMYALKNGFKNKKAAGFLGVFFSFSCILASFGIGNAVQTNTIIGATQGLDLSLNKNLLAFFISLLIFIIIIFGVKGIANVSAVLLPIMSIFYIIFTVIIIFKNIELFPKMITLIFKSAFGTDAVVGGFSGYTVKKAFDLGIRRGIFSNEAGMGSTTIINASSNLKEPAEQGMWGIFEVVFDTIIICSLTAFALLLSGIFDLETGKTLIQLDGAGLVAAAFKSSLGDFSAWFMVISTIFFAFSSVLGWSFYGIRCVEFLFGNSYTFYYKLVFCVASYFGAIANLDFIWIMSDVFNGFMILPNLICIIVLSPVVFRVHKNYIDRKILYKNVQEINYYK